MPGPRLNVNERWLYTRKMIAEKNANRLVYGVSMWVCLSGRERLQALFGQSFIEWSMRSVVSLLSAFVPAKEANA